ncbi:MAG: hypothetical protein IKO26_03620 [Paludibacteraceae bacterium]|nr:hypothetical protein [Paludibacteraceae bacterium]
MVTICLLIAIGAIVYYYLHAHPRPSEPKCKYGCPVPKHRPEPKPAKKEQAKPKPAPNTEAKKPSNVIWEDSCRRLSFEPDGLSMTYNGKIYRFSGDGHEPMAIILHKGEAVAYIHNAFDVEYECQQFRKNPNYRCSTITGRKHDAKHFCLLLTTAIDDGYDWQIDELESKVDELMRYETREIWYRESGVEFGRYGEEEGGREEHHYEHEILYMIVDGHKYHLCDNVNEADALYFFIPGYYGRKQAVLRIHGTNGAVLAAYADDWKSGKTFTPFGHPCDTKTFCEMMVYALRSGKKDFNLRELEKAFDQKDEPQKETGITIYEDDDARLYLEDEIARLRYKGRLYDFGYDGREPFATIDSYSLHVVIRQGENVDATCRYFQKNPKGTIQTITGRELDAAHFCKLLCAAVAHDHGQDSDMEFYMDDLERKAFELEDYQARRKKMDEKSAQKEEGETLHMVYSRESVCAADDYINKSLNIDWADFATLEDLVSYINNYHEDGGFAAIPYTGGDAKWRILSGDTPLAEVGDDGRIISFCGNDPRTPLSRLKPTKLHGERL